MQDGKADCTLFISCPQVVLIALAVLARGPPALILIAFLILLTARCGPPLRLWPRMAAFPTRTVVNGQECASCCCDPRAVRLDCVLINRTSARFVGSPTTNAWMPYDAQSGAFSDRSAVFENTRAHSVRRLSAFL